VSDRLRQLASSESPSERYTAIRGLAEWEEPEAMRLLVALLADERVGESHYSPIHDETVETLVADEAFAALRKCADRAWPAIIEVLPAATATKPRMIELLRAAKPIARIEMPAAAHDALVAHVAAPWCAFERELARRFRDGELDLEGVWQVWIRDHPDMPGAGIPPLVACAKDHAAVAQQLVELLDGDNGYAAAWGLGQLPVVLDAAWVRAVAASKWPERYPILLPTLARYGEPAVAAIPVCVAILATGTAGISGAKLDQAAKALIAFGPLADAVRPQLLERFLTVDETAGLQGSLRRILADVLGKDRLLEELRGRLDWEATDDWYAKMRKKEIRQLLGMPPPH